MGNSNKGKSIKQLLSARIEALASSRVHFWAEATDLTCTIFRHVGGKGRHDMSLCEFFMNSIEKSTDESLNIAFKRAAKKCVAVVMTFDIESGWKAEKDKTLWSKIQPTYLELINELEAKGLGSEAPKRKPTKGVGGKKNGKVLSGLSLMTSKMLAGIEKLESDPATISESARFTTKLEDLMSELADCLKDNGHEAMAEDFKGLLKVLVKEHLVKPEDKSDLTDITTSPTRDVAPVEEQKVIMTEVFKDTSIGGMTGVLSAVEGAVHDWYLTILDKDGKIIAAEECFSDSITSAKLRLAKLLIDTEHVSPTKAA